ncbi:hypothetical protein BBJ28_00011129 [Nothophytophthora sp. Chile5]|nr:hypothetical protein BBJ28_00011129 [Nothophytophthora sp. Chile5]
MAVDRLLLVANLVIITAFIFMSATLFPSLSAHSVIPNDLIPVQHPAPIDSDLELVTIRGKEPQEPQSREPLRPGTYTKVTSDVLLQASEEEEEELSDETKEQMEPTLTEVPGEGDQDEMAIAVASTQASDAMATEQEASTTALGTFPPLSEAPAATSVAIVEGDHLVSPSKPVSLQPASATMTDKPVTTLPTRKQQSSADILELISQLKNAQSSPSETSPPTPELPEPTDSDSTLLTAAVGSAPARTQSPVATSAPAADDEDDVSPPTGSQVESQIASLPTALPSHEEPAEELEQSIATSEPLDDEPTNETELPAAKFDPSINIFEWTPPKDGSVPPSRAADWQKAVREKVAAIRNFQLGGEVLRAFIRERKEELMTLRDELFG